MPHWMEIATHIAVKSRLYKLGCWLKPASVQPSMSPHLASGASRASALWLKVHKKSALVIQRLFMSLITKSRMYFQEKLFAIKCSGTIIIGMMAPNTVSVQHHHPNKFFSRRPSIEKERKQSQFHFTDITSRVVGKILFATFRLYPDNPLQATQGLKKIIRV